MKSAQHYDMKQVTLVGDFFNVFTYLLIFGAVPSVSLVTDFKGDTKHATETNWGIVWIWDTVTHLIHACLGPPLHCLHSPGLWHPLE